jgi:hypothetical protein
MTPADRVALWKRAAKDDPQREGLEAELGRVGVSASDPWFPVRISKFRVRSEVTEVSLSGQMWRREDGQPTTIGWDDNLPATLQVLASLPDDAGPASLWAALAPDAPALRLWAELDRLGVSERLMRSRGGSRCVDLQSAGQGAVYLTDLAGAAESTEVDLGRGRVAQVGGTVEHVWNGSVNDALARLAPLPSEAGIDAFWAAFPDAE